MSTENKKNMEELLQGDIDLGGFDGSDPFGDMNSGTDPFADMQGVSDAFQEIEDTENPFENALTEPVASPKADEPKITETKNQKRWMMVMRVHQMSKKSRIRMMNRIIQIRLKLKSTEWKPTRLRKPRQVC